MRRLAATAALVAIGLGLTGCGGAVAGQPSASGPASGGGSVMPTGASAAPSSTGGGSRLTDQPCSLFSSSDLEQLNASSPPSTGMTGPSADCEFLTGAGAVIVAVVDQGIAQANFQGPPIPVTIGGHKAVKYAEPDDPSSCHVTIAVSDSSRIDIETVTTDLNPPDPCTFGLQVATLVEPHLPAS
jgi:hypothetical protein